jgi:hypothetical protein
VATEGDAPTLDEKAKAFLAKIRPASKTDPIEEAVSAMKAALLAAGVDALTGEEEAEYRASLVPGKAEQKPQATA